MKKDDDEEELVILIDLQRQKHEEIGVKNRKTDNVDTER